MRISDFKRVARLLKNAYAEAEQEALRTGVDVMSDSYKAATDRIRQGVLAKTGFTLEEYRSAKQKVQLVPQEDQQLLSIMEDFEGNLESKLAEIAKRHIPTADEIATIAHVVAQQYIVPPQITNQIIKETIIEMPQIIKETEVRIDDAKLLEFSNNITKLIDAIPRYNLTKLKEEIRSDFAKNFQQNINMLGMPDFRKLALGLQGQIDALRSSPSSGAPSVETPSGSIDDANTSFTVTHAPLYLNINGLIYFVGDGIYTSYGGGTITLSSPVGTGGFIKSIY